MIANESVRLKLRHRRKALETGRETNWLEAYLYASQTETPPKGTGDWAGFLSCCFHQLVSQTETPPKGTGDYLGL